MFDKTDVKVFLGEKDTKLKEYLDVKPLKELGKWPYKDDYDSWEIQSFSNRLFQKLTEK